MLVVLVTLLTGCGESSPPTPTPEPDGGTQTPDASTPPEDAGVLEVCGDGTLQGAEACDDGNAVANDGCAADCKAIEAGWVCATPGQACALAPRCGDGTRAANESCDDRNTTSGDGCDAQCKVESGWNCPAGGRCVATLCGDGIIAGTEQCEDGNATPTSGDGCDSACRLESGYKCPTAGAPCERTTCGDSVVEGTEQCDDGNFYTGDGCSPLCTLEPRCTNGTCTAVCGDGVILPNDTTEECDDGNQRDNDGCSSTCKLEDGFNCTLVEQTPPEAVDLPVTYRDFIGNDLTSVPERHIDFQNKNGAETGIVQSLLGEDGRPVYAKEGTTSSTTHGKAAFDQWYRDTPSVNRTVASSLRLVRQPDTGAYVFDNPTFFPLDTAGWVAEGKEPLRQDADGVQRNFHFTSEVRYWFEYKGTEELAFLGDDDVWVFINGRLALDLGGVHSAMPGTVNLSERASELGLQPGGIYEVVVFQAERHVTRSSYKLTLTNFLTRRTECSTTCGDGIAQEPELCDDGVNDGRYNTCAPGCVFGPRCGDGVRQPAAGEGCDDANSNETDGCNSSCQVVIN